MKSDTPRTDDAEEAAEQLDVKGYVTTNSSLSELAEFARQLERELAEANKELKDRMTCCDAKEMEQGCFRAVKAEQRLAEAKKDAENRKIAILLLLDNVDYLARNCQVTEMVGAVLPREIIERARAAIAQSEQSEKGKR